MPSIRCLGIACIVLCGLFFGCAINATNRVSNQLDLENLNYKLGTQIVDLSLDGKCPGAKSLKVANAETRTEKYCINDTMGCRWYIIPKDLADYVVKHIERKLIESNIQVGEGIENQILISLEEIKAIEGVWSFGSSAKINIQIPEINYKQTYIGESGSGLGFHAVAYAIHLSVDNFFKDPVFQKYVRCQ